MAIGSMHSQEKHKSGPLKQQNKGHKHGTHRSKGMLEKANKGKVDLKGLTKKNKTLDKQQRRHQAKQIRTNKRNEVIEQKRKLGSEKSLPHIVTVLPLSRKCSLNTVLQSLVDSDDSIVEISSGNHKSIISTRHKQRFTFLTPKYGELSSVLDSAKVSDTILFAVNSDGEVDAFGEKCITCLLAQGMPASVHVALGIKDITMKKQGDVKKSINKLLGKWFPEIKLHTLDSPQDGAVVLRHIFSQKQRNLFYRSKRPYMLVQNTEYLGSTDDEEKGVLKISGFIRGQSLHVNRLIHLPCLGDFQMNQIDLPNDPYVVKKVKKNKTSNNTTSEEVEMEESEVKVLCQASADKQESLVTQAEVDPMEGEQTWPTDQELQEAEDAIKLLAEEKRTQKLTKIVPKGMSDYQAAWIEDGDYEDEDNDEDDGDEDDDDEWEDMSDDEMLQAREEDNSDEEDADDQEFDTLSVATTTQLNDEKYDEMYDEFEEQAQMEKYRQERENEMFPDEVDTPADIPTRDRFARYRGLKSFRTSPWDPKENLPIDYAKIFQYQNFEHSKKRAFKKDSDDLDRAEVGQYVTIHVKDVPRTYYEQQTKLNTPFVAFGLLKNEQKMTVMHYVIKRHYSFPQPIKSKERLTFHVGYRKFTACPVFSQHTTGDKFKLERFLPQNDVVVATVYAPTTFPTCPVMVFNQTGDVVATGSVFKSDPNRIVLKKIVLSAHPFKINKKTVVARYMFHNREDILWFKPVELTTKYGRRGHIKEPLGTRGHMKCVFDGQVKAQDTILMNLFKRVYPKWSYEPLPLAADAALNAAALNNEDDHMQVVPAEDAEPIAALTAGDDSAGMDEDM